MNRIKRMAANPYLLLFVFVSILVALPTLRIVFSRPNAPRQSIVPVKSLVPRLSVVSAEAQRDSVRLTLRNDYDKTITAFAVSSSNIITRTELIDTDEVMVPGETRSKFYERPPSPSPEYAITIQAALFEDETSEGNATIIKQFTDARLGEHFQTARILRTLPNKLSPSGKGLKQWQGIRLRIAELPESEAGQSFEFNAALQNAKNLAMGKIDELEQLQKQRGSDVAQRRLTHMKERYEARSVKLRGASKQNQ